MVQQLIDASLFLQMMRAGKTNLQNKVEQVNALNVFPVPDGDTGTNMSLTLTTGVKEMETASAESIGELAAKLSKGLLMGARGNSGVILSQLFRGFSKAVQGKTSLNAHQFADAFQQGVETAYKAVVKPVEGTVLTVAREAAEEGMRRSWSTENPTDVLETICEKAHESLAETTDRLPVLKQAGVVDAGGQGMVFIYEGMLSVLKGMAVVEQVSSTSPFDFEREELHEQVDPETIEHGYCTEFLVQLNTTRRSIQPFNETVFREDLSHIGDSLLVIADEDIVKVHIHAEYPGDALNYAMKYGDLTGIKIDNMREQAQTAFHSSSLATQPSSSQEEEEKKKPIGIVAITTGEGISEIFRSIGVDLIIEGGQSMNPSTDEIAQKTKELACEQIIILPNNKNIILTAEQVSEFVPTPIHVIPTKTIPQGLAAILAFNPEVDLEENLATMTEASQTLVSGEITYAVRDTKIEDMQIRKGDYLGVREGKIEKVGSDLIETSYELLKTMINEESEVLTILYGADTTEETARQLEEKITQDFPEIECEIYFGGQPLYYFLFSVE